MRLVKLGAIGSTNDFLKQMAASGSVENFTAVTAESQSDGRGQMGAKWHSESGKNLIMSVYAVNVIDRVTDIFSVNVTAANAILAVLDALKVPMLTVKWPNDIMSGSKKIGGILIENILKTDGRIESIIGIGLNVNQQNFEGLPKASSIVNVSGVNLEVDELAKAIQTEISLRLTKSDFDREWQSYHKNLFKIATPAAFEIDAVKIMGKIIEVSRDGLLHLELEDGNRRAFAIRQISMLY